MLCYEYALKHYKAGDTIYILKVPLMSGQLSPGGHIALLKKDGTVIEHVPRGKTFKGHYSLWRKKDLAGKLVTFFQAFRPATQEEIARLRRCVK